LSSALSQARAGDEAAFVMLWRALHPPLLRYLTVRGDDAPEDIASETWMHVVKGLSAFEGDAAAFRAWLFTIARHRAIDQGRSRTRRPLVMVGEAADLPLTEHAPSAEDVVVAKDATARALDLVARLPPAQAEIVMLRVVAGLEVADVARLCDKKPGTVRVTVHRALQTLQSLAGQAARHPEARSNREVV
jgi:RNA polymerase sigma-70 factor (ECF subfamily)